jgi:hypothetical protein
VSFARGAAFDQMTVRDALWAVRILAHFSDADLAAIVRSAELDDPAAEAYLIDTLIKRRDTPMWRLRLEPVCRCLSAGRAPAIAPVRRRRMTIPHATR